MKLIWLTDIHLNFLDPEGRKVFYTEVQKTNGDAVLISGDIAEAPSLTNILKEMISHIDKPIYFVLGNHDYYRGEIIKVRKEIEKLTHSERLLFWLPASGPQFLENETILLGQDGWADGRYGDYANSPVMLNDSRLIVDLFQQSIIGKYPLLEKMQELADNDASQLRVDLNKAISQHHLKKIIVLTHVPPFKETCLHEGQISSNDFLPFFGSKATGDVLLETANQNPEIEFIVLCGHTHEACTYQPKENLTVYVGKAEYYQPEVQELAR